MKIRYLVFTSLFLIMVVSTLLTNYFSYVKGQEEITRRAEQTTANVTVLGGLGTLYTSCNPVNFTDDATYCLAPGTANRSKLSPSGGDCGNGRYVRIWMEGTNIPWDLFVNASDIVSDTGKFSITPDNIHVNTTCGGGTPTSNWITLSYGLQKICSDVPYNGVVDLEFYLDVPAGYENTTYFGDLFIWVNSTLTGIPHDNRSLSLPNNITLTICKFIEITWNPETKPIIFPATAAGSSNKATTNKGWPANISNGAKTNIFIDYYINGTDFVNTTVPVPVECPGFLVGSVCKFESGNVTYSNATSNSTWPDGIKPLSNSFATPPPYGDFPNWSMVRNNTETPTWWNISIPSGMPRASYEASIYVKAVDHGTLP